MTFRSDVATAIQTVAQTYATANPTLLKKVTRARPAGFGNTPHAYVGQRPETIVPGPTPDDLAFVASNKLPLFVIGEWARPAPMWEVAWIDDAVRYRNIGEVGEIGPWQD